MQSSSTADTMTPGMYDIQNNNPNNNNNNSNNTSLMRPRLGGEECSLTTDTVRAKERFRMCTGSLVCCFPLEAVPSFEGSLVIGMLPHQSKRQTATDKQVDQLLRQDSQKNDIFLDMDLERKIAIRRNIS